MYGTVIPSFLGLTETPSSDEGTYFNNFELKRGEVIRIIYPTDKGSVTKKFIEYDILIENRANGTANSEIVTNVISFNLLGSLSDRLTWTLRPSNKKPTDSKTMQGDGSKVLVMFIGGEGFRPIIIGGVRDIQDESEKSDKSSDAGHHYEHTFNGLTTGIDKNGAITITFNGPTKNDGKLDTDKVKDEATGSFFNIDKDGNIKLSDKDGKQYYLINHKDGKANVLADKECHIEVSNGKITTKSTGVEHGDATDKMLLGTTYRNAENQLHTKMTSALSTLQALVTTAGINLTTAASLNSTPLIGGTLAGPTFAAAAAAITSMPSAIANLVSAINAFEAQREQFLSKKNKLD
jgi:hypothetical protein